MHEQAAAWVARLRSDSVTDEDYQQFALWLSANPEHTIAFDEMLDLWEDLAVTRHMPIETPVPDIAPNQNRRRWLGGGLAVAASVIFALILAPQLGVDDNLLKYQTDIGEQRVVDLADGSQLFLNTNTRLEVRLGDNQRHGQRHCLCRHE